MGSRKKRTIIQKAIDLRLSAYRKITKIPSELMSKRIEAYRKGLERFFQFAEYHLTQGTIPPPEDIDAELKSIESLRSMEYAVMVPEKPIQAEAGFIIMIGEEFTRYDDALPSLLRICFLPNELDTPKEINRRMTMMPIE